jgi:hypothetical protein
MAVNIKNKVIWYVTSCSFVHGTNVLKEPAVSIFRLLAGSSKTFVPSYQATGVSQSRRPHS